MTRAKSQKEITQQVATSTKQKRRKKDMVSTRENKGELFGMMYLLT